MHSVKVCSEEIQQIYKPPKSKKFASLRLSDCSHKINKIIRNIGALFESQSKKKDKYETARLVMFLEQSYLI